MDTKTFWFQFFLPLMAGMLIGGITLVFIIHIILWRWEFGVWPWIGSDCKEKGL